MHISLAFSVTKWKKNHKTLPHILKGWWFFQEEHLNNSSCQLNKLLFPKSIFICKNCQGPTLWSNGLVPACDAGIPMNAVHILATLLQTNCPLMSLGKQCKMDHMVGLLPLTGVTWMEFQACALAWSSSSCCGHVGVEPVDSKLFHLSVTLVLKQINLKQTNKTAKTTAKDLLFRLEHLTNFCSQKWMNWTFTLRTVTENVCHQCIHSSLQTIGKLESATWTLTSYIVDFRLLTFFFIRAWWF